MDGRIETEGCGVGGNAGTVILIGFVEHAQSKGLHEFEFPLWSLFVKVLQLRGEVLFVIFQSSQQTDKLCFCLGVRTLLVDGHTDLNRIEATKVGQDRFELV